MVKIIQGKTTVAEAKRAYDLPPWRCQSKLLERTNLAALASSDDPALPFRYFKTSPEISRAAALAEWRQLCEA